MTETTINNSITEASKIIGKTWPLYSFVTSNPLSGYEKKSFEEAVNQFKTLFNTEVYPQANIYKQAWEKGNIDKKILVRILKENKFLKSPEHYLEQMLRQKKQIDVNVNNNLDRILAKWLAAFMDEGMAEWTMPNKKEGFYKSWRQLAVYDNQIPKVSIKNIPLSSLEAIKNVIKDYPESDYIKIFSYHLSALPGWVGYINYRSENNTEWQKKYPITIEDYLAVRLFLAKTMNIEINPKLSKAKNNDPIGTLQYIWLQAWEKSWQSDLENLLQNKHLVNHETKRNNQIPDAQLVFCIDTRSELIRRHVESKGNYETFGYAGFFGVAMDYLDLDNGITHKSCPPILESSYKVSEIPQEGHSKRMINYKKKNSLKHFKNYFLKRMKNILPSAFGFVEGSGLFYGLSLVLRTLTPNYFYKLKNRHNESYESFCNPEIEYIDKNEALSVNLPLEQKVMIVKSAFDLMGWKTFAPIVVFVGHGSHTTNNPFGSSLDCGACAASPGRHNARMLAKLANLPEVKDSLKKLYNIVIPDNTVFLGAEHNTTTDEVLLFDANVPTSHTNQLKQLKTSLKRAQQTATQERLDLNKNSVSYAEKKANNWSEIRPEWGLAKNAGFIIGDRELTKHQHLKGRCFLHSYNWKTDKTGSALEAIMQGPMVVTQWINNHYYFSTVDNKTFGSGSKITQNITGKFGVVQGNGGDLKMGLPLQSLMQTDVEFYHEPLRLSVVIQSPLSRVSDIIVRNEKIKELLDNQWIYLMVMDPKDNNNIYHYKKNLNWSNRNTNEEMNSVLMKETKEAVFV